jgi:class 3 adenylate cyclase
METMSPAGRILVTEAVVGAAGDGFTFERHAIGEAKGIGPVSTFLLTGRAPTASQERSRSASS